MPINLDNDKRKIIKDYIENAKNKIVESIDINTGNVKYVKELKGVPRKPGEEEIVRAYILTKLVNELGYSIEKIEIEHEYTAGRPFTNTSRIDIIVRNSSDDTFLFIEVKNPYEYSTMDKNRTIEEQLFKVAGMEKTEGHNTKYLVLYTIDIDAYKIKDECMIIDNEMFRTYSEWEKNLDYLTDIPEHYGLAKKIPYVKGSDKDLERDFTNEMLNYLQVDLHNVLWGGGGTDDNDIFSSLTNLILAKIQDEDEKSNGDEYDFQTKSFEKPDKLFNRINELYRRALTKKLNITDENQLNKSYVVDTNKFSFEKVKYTVQAIERFSFIDGKNSLSGKDILGEFFEGIIREGFKQTKGQFFTPVNIVTFMLWALKTDELAIKRINTDKEIPYMIDPSAGSGTFLIEYMKFITQNIKYRFVDKLDTSRSVEDKFYEWFEPDNRENRWAREYIYGSELNFNLGTSTKVNMILHGDGSTNIFVGTQKGDGLLPFNEYIKPSAPNALNKEFDDKFYSKKVNAQFDLILTNPPFSASLDNDTKEKIGKSFVFGDKKNTENLFIERYYQLLKEKGRLAAVLPESVFDTTENKYIRLFIYKYFNIKAVVSLPQLTFEPYTSTKTSILFAQKKDGDEIERWNEKWNEYSKEYSNLKRKIENIILVKEGKKEKEKLPSIKELTENDERKIINRFLKAYIQEDDDMLSNNQMLDKYSEELKDLLKNDKDTEKEFGHVNTWWVFEEVAKDLDYSILMAEVDNIGYKRTKRGEKKQPNDLYRIDETGKVMVDDGIKQTVLDYMREIKWD